MALAAVSVLVFLPELRRPGFPLVAAIYAAIIAALVLTYLATAPASVHEGRSFRLADV